MLKTIPSEVGAFDVHSVPAPRWLAGDVRRIVQYNEADALSTYLLWLRAALLAGLVTPDEHAREERQLEELLLTRAAVPGNEHLGEYLAAWRDLRAR